MGLRVAWTTTGFMAKAERPRKASEIDEEKFLPEDIAHFNDRFARIIGEHERIGDGFRKAERQAMFEWDEDCDHWF